MGTRSLPPVAGVPNQISKPHHMFLGGVKNKGVGSACSLGPHLHMHTTCSPMSLMDDFLFLFICFRVLSCSSNISPQCGRLFSKTIGTPQHVPRDAQNITRVPSVTTCGMKSITNSVTRQPVLCGVWDWPGLSSRGGLVWPLSFGPKQLLLL